MQTVSETVGSGVQIEKRYNMNCKYKEYNLSNLMTIKELQDYLKIGKNKAYSLVNTNQVPTIRIGNKTYIVVDRLQRYIDRFVQL